MKDKKSENLTSGLEIENFISTATYPLRYLAKLYQISYEETKREVVKMPLKATTDYQKRTIARELSNMEFGFNDLPVNLQLLIFSYLDARTLCKISSTCQYWLMLSEDKILWENLLWTDLQTWKSISHITYPSTYYEASSELSPKQIYLRCCPQCQSLRHSKTTRSSFASLVLHNLQSLPSMFRQHTPKVVMFGPGLESDTSKLVHRLLWAGQPFSPATVVGMFPGEFEGIGSGVRLSVNGKEMNLITLYAACRAEREKNAREGRDRISKLLAAEHGDAYDERGVNDVDATHHGSVEVSHPVKQLCKTVDAFIYVVDAAADSERVNIGDQELQAMVNNSWTQPRVPLLVLSAHATLLTPYLACVKVTEMLRMDQFNHPWQVNSICVENLDGLHDGLNWLQKQIP